MGHADWVIVNEVRRATYFDSVVLMRAARAVASRDGVVECGMMMGTPANRAILEAAGVLDTAGRSAGPGDLVIAIAARAHADAEAALAAAKAELDARKPAARLAGATYAARTIRAAVAADAAANLVLISVPGAFAAAEARKALARGLNVMLFSDNVGIADEVELKVTARERGLLMMGPDCGTAIIGGTPLGFANAVPRGSIGIIGASGTGIQEVSCLIANNGGGISHAIGTGGRDLTAEVGGITTLAAIDLLDRNPATGHIVLVSKPPDVAVAATIVARAERSQKPFTVCFLGAPGVVTSARIRAVATLKEAAERALGRVFANVGAADPPTLGARGRRIVGLFSGGTMCAEAQVVFRRAGLMPTSNVPIPSALPRAEDGSGHVLLDLGADEFTLGRPHPMIEPGVRDTAFAKALADPEVGVILFDMVLGFGAHGDPAGHLEAVVRSALSTREPTGQPPPLLVGAITGTRLDPQGFDDQTAKLSAIAAVCPSNADAAAMAVALVTTGI